MRFIIKRERLTEREFLFLFPYTLFLYYNILSQSFYLKYIEDFTKAVIAITCGMLILIECKTKRLKKREIIAVLGFVLLFFLSLMGSRGEQNNVPAMFLFIIVARNVRYEIITKKTLLISCSILLFIILSAKFGIIKEYIATQWQNDRIRERNYLGFRYALYPSTLMFNITCLIVFLRKNRLTYLETAVLLLINYWFFRQTNSRLNFFLTILLLVMAITLKYTERWLRKKNDFLLVFSYLYVFCFLLSFLFTISYNPNIPWMNTLNSLLGSRLSLGYNSLKENGIPLLGQNIRWIGHGLDALGRESEKAYTYVDSFYIQILQHYGIIFVIIYMTIITLVMYTLIKNKDYYLFAIMALLAFHFIIDDLQLYLYYNTFWLVMGHAVANPYYVKKQSLKRQKQADDGLCTTN